MPPTTSSYRHVQVGWIIVGVTLLALTLLLVVLSTDTSRLLLLLPLLITSVTLATFGFMAVAIDEGHVEIRMGVGLVRVRVPFHDVRSFRRVRNPWYYGWGIKKYPGGTLYNVSGRSAVELELRSGRFIRIGTSEPDALMGALRRALET